MHRDLPSDADTAMVAMVRQQTAAVCLTRAYVSSKRDEQLQGRQQSSEVSMQHAVVEDHLALPA